MTVLRGGAALVALLGLLYVVQGGAKPPTATTAIPAASDPQKVFDRAQAFESNWLKAKSSGGDPPSTHELDAIDRELGEIPLDWQNAQQAMALVGRLRAERPAIEKAYATFAAKRAAVDTQAREKTLLDQRKKIADLIETTFLDAGRDPYAAAEGPEFRTLRLKYVLMSRPLVHQIQKSSKVMNKWRDLGFRKVILTDGYRETWTLSLN